MDQVAVAIECDRDVADDLSAGLSGATGADVYSATKSALDGAPETVLQIVQFALTVATAVPPLLAPFLDRRKIRKIKLGDLEIENPTAEQVERLWNDYLRSSGGADGPG